MNTTELATWPDTWTDSTNTTTTAALSTATHALSDAIAPSSGHVVLVLVTSLIFLFSLAGNITVIYVIGRYLHFKTVTNVYITCLSVSDILTTVCCLPLAMVTMVTGRWYSGAPGCVFNGFFLGTLETVSYLIVTVVTIDKHITLVRISNRNYTARTGFVIVCFCVLVAAFFTFPWFITYDVDMVNRWHSLGVETSDTYHKVGFSHCMYLLHGSRSHNGAIYSLIYVMICFVVPSLCMTYCAMSLLRIIRDNDSQVRPSTAGLNEVRFSGEIRTSKTVLLMIGIHFVSKAPYFLSGIVVFARPDVTISPILDSTLLMITWFTCAANPMLYILRNPMVGQIVRLRKESIYFTKPNNPPPDVIGYSEGNMDQSKRFEHFQTQESTMKPGAFDTVISNHLRKLRSCVSRSDDGTDSLDSVHDVQLQIAEETGNDHYTGVADTSDLRKQVVTFNV